MYGYGISNQSVERFLIRKKIRYQILKTSEEVIDNNDFDIIVKSPGIPFNDQFLLKNQHKPIISDLELFTYFYPKAFIIGITGTVGKTTTVLLLEHLLKKHYKVQIGGNIGIPIFDLDNSNNFDDEILIIECSSYMLASTDNFNPKIMVITNIYPNHLDHHLTIEHYYFSKIKCLNNMHKDEVVLTTKELDKIVDKYQVKKIYLENLNEFQIINNDLYYQNVLIMDNYFQTFTGKHDLFNLWYCLKIGDLLGIKTEERILNGFKKPLYRLNKIYEDEKLIIYNDSKSTNFYSFSSAIQAVNKEEKIHWIGGGENRKEDWYSIKNILRKISFAYLYGENSQNIIPILKELNIPFLHRETLEEVIDSLIIPDQKTVILFSPAAPSTDQFKSYLERGKCFNQLIFKKLIDKKNA